VSWIRTLLCAAALVVSILLAPAARVKPRYTETAAFQAASKVSADSLESMLRFLTVDPATGQLRSRFTFREADLSVIADSLAERLERYTGRPAARTTFTASDEYYDPGTFTAENISVRLPGTGEDSSAFIVCAHFDAIGVRTEGWRENWRTMPAPGANDNGTGIAALMEAARILPDYTLPFDVLFVLFSGEELGKLGSIDFVDRCDSTCAGSILGVFNIDMIGYNEDGTAGGCILSDYSSGWIADMLLSFLPVIDPDLPIRLIKPGPSNWDHASFWENTWNGEPQHIPAVTLAEPLHTGGFIVYPHYHSVGDTMNWIDIDQATRITRLIVGFVTGFSGRPPEMAVLPSDLLLKGEETFWGTELFTIGEEITALIRCRNIGGEDVPIDAGINLSVTLENASGLRTLYRGDLPPPGALRAAGTSIRFTAAERDAGENRLRARISVHGFDDDESNNESEVRFVAAGGGEVLPGHTFKPNPVTGGFPAAEFCVNLAAEANLLVEIYTIEGERVGTTYIGSGYGIPLNVGYTCIPCRELFPAVTNLASGVYLYRVGVYSIEGGSHQYTGRFAVLD
jgi:hypothetical protein